MAWRHPIQFGEKKMMRAKTKVKIFFALIKTPNIDHLAEKGLRYINFHTTALCSPSHKSLTFPPR